MPRRSCLLSVIALLCGSVARAEEGAVPARPLFTRHVVPLFSRLGCNAGICHGAVKGQGGFRLSLFGAEPGQDHAHLLRDGFGRRLNLISPEDSLLLLKAAARIEHQGGRRLQPGSPAYRLLHTWIVQGAKLDPAAQSALAELTITPASHVAKVGESYDLKVAARFADGSTEDVTSLCTFESKDRQVAEVDERGTVKVIGVGDAALVIRYRSEPKMAAVLAPGEAAGAFPEVKEHNFIDRHVLDKLRRLNIHPAPLCDDATFLRRAALDITGTLPTPAEVRAFLADTSADKRAKKIDELLTRPGYTALWATRFCDILKPGGYFAKSGIKEEPNTRRFYEWVRARLTDNLPYDQFVERILLATSREGRSEQAWLDEVRQLALEEAATGPDLKAYAGRRTLDLYWQRDDAAGVKGTLQVAHAFLGLRLECAQCHRHPHDVWQQDDLLSFANFFMAVSRGEANGSSPGVVKAAGSMTDDIKKLKDQAKSLQDKTKDKSLAKEEKARLQKDIKTLNDQAKALEDLGKRLKNTEIHTQGKRDFASVTSTIGKQDSKTFRLLGSKEVLQVPADQDPRAIVMDWLRRPDNPYFTRAVVNRVWAHYFGRGIVDPPDQLSPLNPASHPELLQELTRKFIENKYDLKWLHRTIVQSRTYQQSGKTNATNKYDTANYASFQLRRLPAEVLVDAINQATGGTETYPDELRLPAGARAIEVAGSSAGQKQPASLHYALSIFGRPLRRPEVQCDCERDSTPTIVQTLYLANHPRVREKLSGPGGRLAQIVKDISDDGKRVDEVFLWTLSRLPTAKERQACLDYLKESASPQKGLEDVLWSLINTREFLLNH
ncbi:MAG: DUF1549 domain-containing protein [Gemmataceae bacterium]